MADALCEAGLAQHAQGLHEQAVATFDRALAIRSDDAVTLNNRGVALGAIERYTEALADFDKALAVQPGYVMALYNRGRAFEAQERYQEAIKCYDQVLALEPRHAVALNNRGASLDTIGRHKEAVESFDRALEIEPDYMEALNNRGTALAELARPQEALASYDAALAIDPGYVDCVWNRSIVHLRQGAFIPGWHGFEARRRQPSWDPRHLSGPEWDGVARPGQRVFLYSEQGLGDTIQFARFARIPASMGMDVTLEVQVPLVKLIQSMSGVRVIGKGAPLPEFDCHLPLMSIPKVMGLTAVEVQPPYLAVDQKRVELWSRQLSRRGFCVGIAWQGNPRTPSDRGRSIPLREYRPLARASGVQFISLQKNDGVDQLKRLPHGWAVKTFGTNKVSGAEAFIDTAAVMMNMDLVITSDTAVAHLAGALGCPVWIALKHVPCWRWQTTGARTAWYPTARLYRQEQPGQWQPVFERIAADLMQVARRS